MPLNELLFGLIGLTLAMDVAVVTVAAFRRQHGRPNVLARVLRPRPDEDGSRTPWAGGDEAESVGGGSPRLARRVEGRTNDAATAAAIEAFVAGIDGNTDRAISRRVEPDTASPRPPGPSDGLDPSAGEPDLEAGEAGAALTWKRMLREESARVARFGRPVTVVLAACPELDAVAELLGSEATERIADATGRLLRVDGRAADRFVRLGRARFGVLLIETDEQDAGPYVERVRTAADRWFESAGLSIRLAVGWAGVSEGDLEPAVVTARERMHALIARSGTRSTGRASQ